VPLISVLLAIAACGGSAVVTLTAIHGGDICIFCDEHNALLEQLNARWSVPRGKAR
jgi:hypothetical protein